jgi:prevent-host-death family protein
MTVSEARAALPQLLDRVAAGEEITITRHGHAVATLVRPDALVSRRADAAYAAADRVRQLLARGRAADLRETTGSRPSARRTSSPRCATVGKAGEPWTRSTLTC